MNRKFRNRAIAFTAVAALSLGLAQTGLALPVDQAGMENAIAHYRQLAANGGWQPIPKGPALKPGAEDERVPLLRQRLAATGELDPASNNGSQVLDAEVEAALHRFQELHGLEEDAILGPEALAALNISAEQRAQELEQNLERWRGLMGKLGSGKAIVVNIPDFSLLALQDGQTALQQRVIVGKEYQATPSFSEMMEYVVFNPSWYVPSSITTKELLPKLKKNPGYLEQNNMELLLKGKAVPASSISWGKVGKHNFPYTVRQKPGKDNSLGRVKFVFPNKEAVYLHDTPNHNLFDERERAFSHGCIRVENPPELAAFVLGWGAGEVQAAIDAGAEKKVNLPSHIPVHIVYQTAWVEPDGTIRFREDIYGRNSGLIQAKKDKSDKKSKPATEQARSKSKSTAGAR